MAGLSNRHDHHKGRARTLTYSSPACRPNPRHPERLCRPPDHPPMPGFTHTVLPLLRNNLLAISDESVHEAAADFPKLLWFADVSHEASPLIISSAPLPPVAEFAHRGGRFGAHNL